MPNYPSITTIDFRKSSPEDSAVVRSWIFPEDFYFVRAEATISFSESTYETWPNDLTILLKTPSGSITSYNALQIGGYSDLGMDQRLFWVGGGSPNDFTGDLHPMEPIFASPIKLPSKNLSLWIGNGWDSSPDIATAKWSGEIRLFGSWNGETEILRTKITLVNKTLASLQMIEVAANYALQGDFVVS